MVVETGKWKGTWPDAVYLLAVAGTDHPRRRGGDEEAVSFNQPRRMQAGANRKRPGPPGAAAGEWAAQVGGDLATHHHPQVVRYMEWECV